MVDEGTQDKHAEILGSSEDAQRVSASASARPLFGARLSEC